MKTEQMNKNTEWNIKPSEVWKEITSETIREPVIVNPDENGNAGWFKDRMCPNCFYTEGALWIYPPCKVSIRDRGTLLVHFDHNIHDGSIVKCECCGEEGPFSEWEIDDHNKIEKKKHWSEGNELASMRRRPGTSRMRVYDLYKFTAKKGADNVLRWCITRTPLCKHIDNHKIAKHICRHLELQLINTELKHRQKVRTMGTMAETALTGI